MPSMLVQAVWLLLVLQKQIRAFSIVGIGQQRSLSSSHLYGTESSAEDGRPPPPSGLKVTARSAYLAAARKKRGAVPPDKKRRRLGTLGKTREVEVCDEKEEEVILLGAGIASMYAGLILKDLGLPFRIFEADEKHIGGRILTHVPPGCNRDNYEYVDYGAMRIPDLDIMQRVFNLICSRLDLKLLPYYLSNKNGEDVSFFNGWRFPSSPLSPEDPKNADETFAEFVPQEYIDIGHTVLLDQVFHPWLENITRNVTEGVEELMRFETLSTRQYIQQEKGWPTPVIDWLETFETSSGLFDRAFSESVFDYIDFNAAKKWYCVDKGMQTVTDALLDTIGRQVVFPGHVVTKISPSASDKVRVTLGLADGTEMEVEASDVISTLPLGPLRAVDTSECDFPVGKRIAHRVLAYDVSVKVCLVFRSRWWEDECQMLSKRVGGQDSNDQPTRTIVFPSYGIGHKGKGVIIGSYTWAQDAQRMAAMTEEQQIDRCLQDLQDTYGEELPSDFDWDKELIREACSSHAWEASPWMQGAFALFGPGQFSTYYDDAISPELDGRLHFGGEALDIHHAWIIGSLNSAWRCVDEILKRRGDSDRLKQFHKEWGNIDEIDVDIVPDI